MAKTKRSERRDDIFFEMKAQTDNIGLSAKAAGYSRRVVYEYRDEDDEFSKRWQEAEEEHIERLEMAADQRAVEGVTEPVFYQGQQCGTVKKYSDTLLMFRLKAKAPEKYRDRQEIKSELSGPNGGPIEVKKATELTDEQLAAIAASGS